MSQPAAEQRLYCPICKRQIPLQVAIRALAIKIFFRPLSLNEMLRRIQDPKGSISAILQHCGGKVLVIRLYPNGKLECSRNIPSSFNSTVLEVLRRSQARARR